MDHRPSREELQKKVDALEEQLDAYQSIEKLLGKSFSHQPRFNPETTYGNIAELNTCRLIMDAVGEKTLRHIAEDAINLLESSVAVYERNGDYAFGMFASHWCRLLDNGSRQLCNTDDNLIALASGRWLCHECCWNEAAKAAIVSGKSIDEPCVGGIRLYAEPIYAQNQVIGAIVIGHGNPPRDSEALHRISDRFQVDFQQLRDAAQSYPTRPSLVFELAKKRLSVSAQLIGEIVYRSQSVNALRESEEKHRLIFQNSPIGILHFDENGKITACNDVFIKSVGSSRDRLIGYNMLELPDKKIVAAVESALQGQNGFYKDTYQSVTAEKSTPVRVLFAPCRNQHGQIVGGMGIVEDITKQKKSEDDLQQSEERYRFLVETSNDIIWIFDLSTMAFTFCSHSVEHILGYPAKEMPGWNLKKVFSPEIKREIQVAFGNIVTGKNPSDRIIMEAPHLHMKGDLLWMEIDAVLHRDSSGKPLSFTGVSRNITDRKQAAEEREQLHAELRHAQKMEAVGTLTGGIAHDFNNLLRIILGYTELMQNNNSQDGKTLKWLNEIRDASMRARDVVRHLLTFSRKSEEQQVPLRVDTVVREALKMMRSILPSSIEFRKVIDRNLPLIKADPTQIHQVIINLCKNAADAMEEQGGTMAIRLEKSFITTDDAAFDTDLSPGEYVKLTVTDTGKGIYNEEMDRIFDPYFTTKPMGKGTGLGLSVVHGIIRAHGGGIRVRSDIGRKTTFELFFPAARELSESPEIEISQKLSGGSETILFVDDEPSMTDLNRLRLQTLGYRVVSETDPIRALEIFRNQPEQFDLVITDMTMPHLTGDRLTEQILDIRPDMKIILCTGFSEKISPDSARDFGIAGYLEKPFGMHDLAATVRKILDSILVT